MLAAVVALVAAGCAAPSTSNDPLEHATPELRDTPSGQRVHHEAAPLETALCTVLPTQVVGDLIGAGAALDASGSGSQCTWRGPGSTPGAEASGHDPDLVGAEGPTLQGALVDVRAYDAGRPVPGDPSVISVADVQGVGDEAFIVRVAGGAPTTLFVRDGHRALSLWLDHAGLTPEATERSLARTASLLLNLA